ncbi:MAG: hypothetical protein KKF48_00450 [Nanoarchaeota archaeon]|nr:hypothetical protein [Nanoarchaeota archaeon]MBU1027495.1 hypothetical protein [Nanoarchaeota archaeon]
MDNKQIIQWNIQQSKKNIKKNILKDRIIIFFTRIVEDLGKYKNPNFYGRLKELFLSIYPYFDFKDTKQIYDHFKKLNFKSREGLLLDKEEIDYVKFFINNLDSNCKIKDRNKVEPKIKEMLSLLVKKYLPNSSVLIEPYLLGKIISSVGGIKNLYRKPSSTIQLIGAERAMFRHISKKKPSPKYGLIYYSGKIQNAKDKGKTSRRLANKLILGIRIDYFQMFAQ